MKKHLSLKIFGRVQGVGFRYWAMMKAKKTELAGYAENLENGALRIEIEGEEKNVDEFLEWAKEGPIGARVNKIEKSESMELHGFESFSVR